MNNNEVDNASGKLSETAAYFRRLAIEVFGNERVLRFFPERRLQLADFLRVEGRLALKVEMIDANHARSQHALADSHFREARNQYAQCEFIRDAAHFEELQKKARKTSSTTCTAIAIPNKNLKSGMAAGLKNAQQHNKNVGKLTQEEEKERDEAKAWLDRGERKLEGLAYCAKKLRDFQMALREYHQIVDFFPSGTFYVHALHTIGCLLFRRKEYYFFSSI